MVKTAFVDMSQEESEINEVYLHEKDIPKSCFECKFTDDSSDFPNIWCNCTGELVNDGEEDITEKRHKTCPIRSLESVSEGKKA